MDLQSRALEHCQLRNRNDKSAIPISDMFHLLHDFIFDVPRKNHHVIGLGLPDSFRRVDWNMSSWQKTALLVGAAINRVLDHVRAHSTVIQKSVRLGRCTISHYRLLLRFCGGEEIKQ